MKVGRISAMEEWDGLSVISENLGDECCDAKTRPLVYDKQTKKNIPCSHL